MKLNASTNKNLKSSCFFRLYILIQCLGFINYNALHSQTIKSSQKDVIIIDNGAPGKADPNDRIRYDVSIENTGGSAANALQLNVVPDLRTTLIPGSFRTSPLAINDSYTSTGNVGLNVPAASGLKTNDFDDNIPGLTLTVETKPTALNGTVMIALDGSFMYIPPAGFTGTDNFTYTLHDSNGVGGTIPNTDVGTVTITVNNLIWFIDNSSAAVTSDGRLTSPFKTLADFNAASGPAVGHMIYLEQTGINYTGGITLKNDQILFGKGHTGGVNLANVLPFSLAPNSKTLPNINGTRPVIMNAGGDGISLAQNNNLRGFDVGNCQDFGMDNNGTNTVGNLIISEVGINNNTGGGFDASNGSGASMNVVFSNISSNGGTNGIDLTNCAGTFTVNAGTITNPTGTGVLISGGSVVFSSTGNISDNSGFAVDIDNHDSGNVNFSGNITSTGTGIRVQNCGGGIKTFSGASKNLMTSTNTALTLNNNLGATISFSNGGLAIGTSSGNGINSTGGGTVSITGLVNTINTATGTALNINNTLIGSSNINFQSISSNGASKGIVLNTTGASGGLIVTGTGNTAGTGGTIQNCSQRGAEFISTNNISLKNMNFTNVGTTNGADPTDAMSSCGGLGPGLGGNLGCNAGIHLVTVSDISLDKVILSGGAQQGINGNNVTDFTMINSSVTNFGDQTREDGLHFNNLLGNCSISSSTVTGNEGDQIRVLNSQGTLGGLNINEGTFGTSSPPNGTSSIQFEGAGTALMTITVQGATLSNNAADGFFSTGSDNAMVHVNVDGCTIQNNLNAGINCSILGSANSSFSITNNSLSNISGNCINLNLATPSTGTFQGTVSGNNIGTAGVPNSGSPGGGTGVRIVSNGGGTMHTLVKNNHIYGLNFGSGIDVFARDGNSKMNTTITGNTIDLLSVMSSNGIVVASGAVSSDLTQVCADIGGAGALANTIANSSGLDELRVRNRFAGTQLRLPGYSGSGTDIAAIVAYLQSRNNNAGQTSATLNGNSVGGGAVCTQPIN